MEIAYEGERLIWGTLGRLFVVLSFTGALFSAVSYWFAHREPLQEASWRKLARWGFRIHSLSVLGIIGVLFFLLFNHYFEYQYVWQHSNRAMPMQYILSCFWEGQEGSFLLWSFWNMLLGNLLIRTAKDWEYGTMTVVALVQVFLASMLLGIYVDGVRIGSDPFILLREHPDFMNLPFVQSPAYLQNLDGRGLNPLLQNYWMTIHPPTLFLGFALTLFPFVYAVAGLIRKKYHEWIAPALPWVFAGICILGTGILMGGAWAYEALSFGGFWAWDPVENASLVPWLTLVAAGHVMLVNRNKGQSVTTAFFLVFTTFILILYSTFLTRSGILGDTSVHAFTDLGMSGQLLVYLFFFVWLPSAFVVKPGASRFIYLLASAGLLVLSLLGGFSKLLTASFLLFSIIITLHSISKATRTGEPEEDFSSREFWMFIGALVLMISAFQITFSTSTPVINKFLSGNLASFFGWLNELLPGDIFRKLAEANMATPKDPVLHYNAWQIPFAIIIGLLIGFGQFLKYNKTAFRPLLRRTSLALVLALVVTLVLDWQLQLRQVLLLVLLFAALFAVFANLDYFFKVVKGRLRNGGASVAHAGFGLILLGALISTAKKEFISQNNSAFDLGKDFPNRENILLARNDTVKMGEYLVSYRGDSTSGINIYYNVDYFKPVEDGKPEKLFTLSPLVQTNPRMGNVAEPATKHYLHKDVFTHVTYAQLETGDSHRHDEDEWEDPKELEMRRGDTVFSSNSMIVLENIERNISPAGYASEPGDIAVGARLKILDVGSRVQYVMPLFVLRNNRVISVDTTLEEQGMQFSFRKIDPAKETFHIRLRERHREDDFIIMKAIIFPGINILWTGCILMALGTALAVWSRIRRRNLHSRAST